MVIVPLEFERHRHTMFISIRKAYRDLTRRRLRSFLTVIGIIIGVAGLVAITSTSKNMTTAQAEAYNNNSQQDMRWGVGYPPISVEAAVEDIPNVDAAELRAIYLTKWNIDGSWRDIRFNGVSDFGNMRVNKIDLVEGRWPKRGEVALDASVREVVPVSLGDEIAYRAGVGNQMRKLVVVGFAKSPSYPSATIIGTASAFTLDTDVQAMYAQPGNNQLLVRLADFSPGTRTETKAEIELLFQERS